MAKFSGQLGRLGPLDSLADFEFDMAVLGIGSGPNGFAAPWRFKILDSQPDSLNMGPVWTDVHDFCDFQKSGRSFQTWYLPCFRPGCFQIPISEDFGQN